MKILWTPWMVIGALALAGIAAPSAPAQSVYSVAASHAQGLTGRQSPVIHLWSGYGTNLSFIPTNERIVRVWLDDPSRVALDFDEPLCPAAASDCVSGSPSVIHLRRIEGLTFENLPRASGTLLTVMTETSGGERRLYKFRIAFGSGTPDYHTVVVNPSSPIHPLLGPGYVRRGLQVAEARGFIHPNQDLWNRLQTFLRLTQDGLTVPAAAEQAGVSSELLIRLAEWGASARDDPPLRSTAR
ncbi:hypothetical protein [Phormidium sp. FACHB-1136]|uniref:hypothetical protein n=1 Tax=Phormidium sp. FACHB-1136 TaxID=2692848 RepID=UPI00168647A6|nr:hypothetical protein [Phormidium sp. FACHB-1136]